LDTPQKHLHGDTNTQTKKIVKHAQRKKRKKKDVTPKKPLSLRAPPTSHLSTIHPPSIRQTPLCFAFHFPDSTVYTRPFDLAVMMPHIVQTCRRRCPSPFTAPSSSSVIK
jgi:hypothetical protein